MKKILHVVPVAMVSVAFIGLGNVAHALPNCDVLVINDTGPGSNNQVVCQLTTDVTVTCDNNVYVLDTNSQNAITGTATVEGNVTSGTAITGNATNENNETVAIGASCGPEVKGTSTTPGKGSINPPTGGAGSFSLPTTSSSSIAPLAIASFVGAGIGAGASRLVAVAYRRFHS